jgi:hypothetical protein
VLLDLAREEALATHGVVNTGHLLLAVIRAGDSVHDTALRTLDEARLRSRANRRHALIRRGLTPHALAAFSAATTALQQDPTACPSDALLTALSSQRCRARRLLRGPVAGD